MCSLSGTIPRKYRTNSPRASLSELIRTSSFSQCSPFNDTLDEIDTFHCFEKSVSSHCNSNQNVDLLHDRNGKRAM